jgi:hypothetical protein
MSLYNSPSFSVSEHTPCTCGLSEGLFHHDRCAKVDEKHPAREKARETVQREARLWFGPNDERGRR